MIRHYRINKATLILIAGTMLCVNCATIDPVVPEFTVPQVSDLAVPPTQITIPLSLPLSSIEAELEKGIPAKFSGTERWTKKFLFFTTSYSLDWEVRRSKIRIYGDNDHISAVTTLAADAEFKGLRIADLKGRFTATMTPKLISDWRLKPYLTTNFSLARAKLLWISVRSKVRPALNRELEKIRKKLDRRISEDDFIENAVRESWSKLCGTFPLGAGEAVWLQVKPVSVRSAQPFVDAGTLNLQFGLDAETRIVGTQMEPECPFPNELILEDSRPGDFQIVLPILLDYEFIESILRKKFDGETLFERDAFSVIVNDVGVHPDGDNITLAVTVTMRSNDWFGTRAQGTVYISATPIVNAAKQEIVLKDFELDIASRNAVVEIFGEIAEPILLGALGDDLVFDVSEKLEEVRREATKMLNEISANDLQIDGQVSAIRLTRLDVGPDQLHIVATAQGSATASVHNISLSSN